MLMHIWEEESALDLGLNGRTALVTGGSKGIGAAIAYRLAEAGCNLHLSARSAAELDKTRSAIKARYNVSVQTHALDLLKSKDVEELARRCEGIDILYNNAGATPSGPI